MNNLVRDAVGKSVIVNRLPGTVFRVAVENREVFAGPNIGERMAVVMYICTRNTISLKNNAYNVPEVIAVEGPDNRASGDYKINITFGNNGKVTMAKIVSA